MKKEDILIIILVVMLLLLGGKKILDTQANSSLVSGHGFLDVDDPVSNSTTSSIETNIDFPDEVVNLLADPKTRPIQRSGSNLTTKSTTPELTTRRVVINPTTQPTTQSTTRPTTQPTTRPTTQSTARPTTQPTTRETTEISKVTTTVATTKELFLKYFPSQSYEETITVLAKVLHAEAGGVQSTTNRASVLWCVFNRSDAWGKSPIAIATAPSQFAYRRGEVPSSKDFALTYDVMDRWLKEKEGVNSGRVLPASYLYFIGDGRVNHFRVYINAPNALVPMHSTTYGD